MRLNKHIVFTLFDKQCKKVSMIVVPLHSKVHEGSEQKISQCSDYKLHSL